MSPKTKLEKVYLYVAATVPLNDEMCDQIRDFALQQLKADPNFRQIMDKIERDETPIVKGHGIASSPQDFVNSFSAWLSTQGISLNQAHTYMGKKIFVHAGDSQNPADGSTFTWGLIGCFLDPTVGICWFCESRPTVASAVVEVKLRGNGEVERMPKHERTMRNEVTIRVPRCARCKSKYRKARHIDEVGKLVVFLILLAGCGLTAVIGNLGTWFVILWLIALGAMCVGILFGFGYWKDKVLRGIEEKQAVDFPEVQKMKEQGMEVTWWSRP